MRYVVSYVDTESGRITYRGFDYKNDALEWMEIYEKKHQIPTYLYVKEELTPDRSVRKFDIYPIDDSSMKFNKSTNTVTILEEGYYSVNGRVDFYTVGTEIKFK